MIAKLAYPLAMCAAPNLSIIIKYCKFLFYGPAEISPAAAALFGKLVDGCAKR
ncbi:hypothetical protein [Tianweitania sediminis]|uniref:Uncharacterized protein n=1 Tax=Tianweitania sediminis TaxID=1502156 RepID=A0A8J7RK14_9HYPH|nr:hypothetical protein [Tianweitania sediminis]MBP0438681.1 hypothetical protein [Tianweitania sediminis]